MSYKKYALGCFLSIFFPVSFSLSPMPLLLASLESKGLSAGIIGVDVEVWVVSKGRSEVSHQYITREGFRYDSDYRAELIKIIEREMMCEGEQPFDVAFWLEGRKKKTGKKKTPLFLYKAFSWYKRHKKECKNDTVTCLNTWDERIEQVCRFTSDSIAGSRCRRDRGNRKNTFGYYKGIFANVYKKYDDSLESSGIARSVDSLLCDWQRFPRVFIDCTSDLSDAADAFDVLCKRFGGGADVFATVNSIIRERSRYKCKGRGCDCSVCLLFDLVDGLSCSYWAADHYADLIRLRARRCRKRVIIVCGYHPAVMLSGMLVGSRFKTTFYRNADNRLVELSGGKISKKIFPYECKSFINFVLGRCNECGELGRKRCSCCRGIWYCNAECQGKDWVNHKPCCKNGETSPKKKKASKKTGQRRSLTSGMEPRD